MWYKAEYEYDDFQMILADNDIDALKNALEREEEYGILLNIFLLDDNDKEIKKIY